MFSLSEAKILDKNANESNYMTILDQLIGLNLDGNLPIFGPQGSLANLSGNKESKILTMGGTKKGILEIIKITKN